RQTLIKSGSKFVSHWCDGSEERYRLPQKWGFSAIVIAARNVTRHCGNWIPLLSCPEQTSITSHSRNRILCNRNWKDNVTYHRKTPVRPSNHFATRNLAASSVGHGKRIEGRRLGPRDFKRHRYRRAVSPVLPAGATSCSVFLS